MIIILEGCDKTGKTTLANKLFERTDFKMYKSSQPKKPPYEEYMEMLDIIGKEDAIIDRFHLGEMVYGPIYRGKSNLTNIQFKYIEDRLKKLKTVVIYCSDDSTKIAKRFKKDKEEFTKEQDIVDILLRYYEIIKKSTLPILHHQINKNDLTKIL